jgi:MSHA biogenesis protein MshO
MNTASSSEFQVSGFKSKGTKAIRQRRNSKLETRNLKPRPRGTRGVTLVEMIVVIVITGILAAAVALFIRRPIEGYMDAARRVELTDIADTALRRMTRDLRTALPNSVRVTQVGSAYYIEYLEVRTGGRFRSEVPAAAVPTSAATCPDTDGDTFANENVLQFGAADACFTTIGDIPDRTAVTTSDFLVVFNLGAGRPNADAYANGAVTGGNKSLITAAVGAGAGGENVVQFQSHTFPLASPGRRFQIVSGPVTYACVPPELRRYWGYPISAAQATPPGGGNNALVANNVAECSFIFAATSGASQRTGVVALTLKISQSGEAVSLFQQVHVNNVP